MIIKLEKYRTHKLAILKQLLNKNKTYFFEFFFIKQVMKVLMCIIIIDNIYVIPTLLNKCTIIFIYNLRTIILSWIKTIEYNIIIFNI